MYPGEPGVVCMQVSARGLAEKSVGLSYRQPENQAMSTKEGRKGGGRMTWDREKQIIRGSYNKASSYYDELMEAPYQIFYRERIKRIIFDQIQPKGMVLDIGCGTGFPSRFLSEEGNKVVAFDISQNMVKKACESMTHRNSIHYLIFDAEEPYPFQESVFDYVTAIGSLSHVEKLSKSFSEIKRVCKAGARFVATFASRYWCCRILENFSVKTFILRSSQRIKSEEMIKTEKLISFLYDPRSLVNEMKGYFKILDVQGVGFVPFIAGIQSSTKLVEKMETYIKLEQKLARRKIFRNLGMGIMIVAGVLK